jgi:hypothetical protein
MADLMWRKRILGAKVEGTAGSAESLTGTEAAWNIYDAKIAQGIDIIPRESQASFSQMSAVLGPYLGSATFRTHLFGAASLPAWTAFLPACGYVETSRVFKPVTAPPGVSGVKTMTIGLWEDGLYKSLRGAMGTFVITFEAGRPIYIDWSFSGVWVPPVDAALPTPDYPTETPLRFAASTLRVASWAPKVSRMTINANNELYVCEDGDSSDQSGLKYAIITGRKPGGSFDPQSTLVATNDIYGQFLARTELAMSMKFFLGTNTGILIDAPKMQFTGPNSTDRNKLQVDQCDFQFNKSADAGDDELTIEFDTT